MSQNKSKYALKISSFAAAAALPEFAVEIPADLLALINADEDDVLAHASEIASMEDDARRIASTLPAINKRGIAADQVRKDLLEKSLLLDKDIKSIEETLRIKTMNNETLLAQKMARKNHPSFSGWCNAINAGLDKAIAEATADLKKRQEVLDANIREARAKVNALEEEYDRSETLANNLFDDARALKEQYGFVLA
jgi:chromosome segregation ATPase